MAKQIFNRRAGTRPSFSFLHTYEATGRYWHGLEKAGLLRDSTGVRLVHSPWGEDARRFNTVARRRGELHRIVEQRRRPLIIDRIAGGSPYRDYDFDQRLIDGYAELLGDQFLGGQVHEVVCNVRNDWDRIAAAVKEFETGPVRPEELRGYFTWEDAARWLECGGLEDYAGRARPRDDEERWKEVEWAARRHAGRFGKRFSCCEGSRAGEGIWHAFYRMGALCCLAEVGAWASVRSQFAIACLRGAARAAGRRWGVYFAPWGPVGCTAFTPESDWSWQVPGSILAHSGFPAGPHLGPSTALQRRAFFHTYLSGAWTLHEEWGAECNLTDWDTGRISSYGRVTRDLLDFQEGTQDVGEPYTPLALVLDTRLPSPQDALWMGIERGLFNYGPADNANSARENPRTTEANCYAPCAVPELFDIVPSDASQEVWDAYRKVVHISTDDSSLHSAEEQVTRIVQSATELSPFERQTHLPLQINYREADGAWILGLYNPWGAVRGDVDGVGSVLDEDCAVHDSLRAMFRVKAARALYAWPESSRLTLRDGTLDVVVGPGGTLVIEVLPE